jgi:hypothetical protein
MFIYAEAVSAKRWRHLFDHASTNDAIEQTEDINNRLSSSALLGFLPTDKSYNMEVKRIEITNGSSQTLFTRTNTNVYTGTSSLDVAGERVFNTVEDLADAGDSYNLLAFKGGRPLGAPISLPVFPTSDLGVANSVLTAYDTRHDRVICAGPVSFDSDGYFAGKVVAVDVKNGAVKELVALPDKKLRSPVTRATIAPNTSTLVLSYDDSEKMYWYFVDIDTGKLTKLANANMVYLDVDLTRSRVVGFCENPAAAFKTSSCVLNLKTGVSTFIADLQGLSAFPMAEEVEFAYDAASDSACWMVSKDGETNELACHDFSSGKLLNAAPKVAAGLVGIIFLPTTST